MIAILKSPKKYSPTGNPIIFSLSGNSNNLVLFKVAIIEAKSNLTIYTADVFPLPTTPTVGTINLSKVLESAVKSEIDNSYQYTLGVQREIFKQKPKNSIGYKLVAIEYNVINGIVTAAGSAFTTSTFYAYNGDLDILFYTNQLTQDSHLIKTGSTGTFLSLQPRNKIVNDKSSDQLYFLQDGLTGVTATYTIGGTNFNLLVTGSTFVTNVVTPAIPEVRATARLRITNTAATNNNIGIYANSILIGSYTIPTIGLTSTNIANNLAQSLISNVNEYSISYTGGTNIYLTAPVGNGTTAISLSGAMINTATTSTTVTASTKATAIVSGYTLPAAASITYIDLADPDYGGITLAAYTVANDDTTLSTYTTSIVDAINTNGYGYTAVVNSSSRFTITGRNGTGANMNGINLYYSNPNTIVFSFSGGVTTGTGSTTTFHSIIPNSITGFTGGANSIAASTASTTTFLLEPAIRLHSSPKAIIENEFVTGFTENQTYTIQLKHPVTNAILSDKMTYTYNALQCNLEAVNVLWINSLGGVDSIQLINPQTTTTTTRLNITKNNINPYSDTPYITNGVFNQKEQTYGTSTKANVKLYTLELSNELADWLVDMVKSKQHYFELSTGQLMPVQLVTNNYNIQHKKYLNNKLNQFQFEFQFDENILPSLGTTEIIIN